MSAAEPGPTISAMFKDGPLAGRSIEAEVLEGRPPKTLDASADDGSTPCDGGSHGGLIEAQATAPPTLLLALPAQ